MPIHRTLNRNFFKKWTHDMAYVLGFFAADGTMVRNNRGAHFIEFHVTDKEILLKIRKALGSNHKISTRDRGNERWKLGYRLQFGSKEVFNDLTRLGFSQNKSLILKLPSIPKNYFRDFVRGYFDGDGCVYFRKHKVKDRNNEKWIFSSRFTSGSLEFLKSLHSELFSHNIKRGRIHKKMRGYELVLSHRDSLALYNLMYNTNYNGLCLERKRKLFHKAVNILYGIK